MFHENFKFSYVFIFIGARGQTEEPERNFELEMKHGSSKGYRGLGVGGALGAGLAHVGGMKHWPGCSVDAAM